MKQNTNSTLTWLAIATILATGIIHFIEVPENLQEVPYKGVLFILNGIGAMLAGILIAQNNKRGWLLGAAIASSAAVGYVLSRTVGLPLLPAEPDAWFEPLGIGSLLVEVAFLGVLSAWYSNLKPANQAVQG